MTTRRCFAPPFGLVLLACASCSGGEEANPVPTADSDAAVDAVGADIDGSESDGDAPVEAQVDAQGEDSDAPGPCRGQAVGGAPLGQGVTLSDPLNGVAVPAIAARGAQALVAWHEFTADGPRIAYSLITSGCVGPLQHVEDSVVEQRRPSVAATDSGWVMVYLATDQGIDSVHLVELSLDGAQQGPPESLSDPTATAYGPRVAASGSEVVTTWRWGDSYYFARRGTLESVPPSTTGQQVVDSGSLNFPRVAIAPDGTVFLAYRDGGDTAGTWDVRLRVRPPGGSFGAETNVSKSPGWMSDDLSVAVEDDGTLDLVWVEQGGSDGEAFEVVHAQRGSDGTITAAEQYGAQHDWAWSPSVVPGLTTAWYLSQTTFGDLYLAEGPQAPERVVAPEQGMATVLARGDSGQLHLAFVGPGDGTTRIVRYAWGQ